MTDHIVTEEDCKDPADTAAREAEDKESAAFKETEQDAQADDEFDPSAMGGRSMLKYIFVAFNCNSFGQWNAKRRMQGKHHARLC